jgi:hypothetical protein
VVLGSTIILAGHLRVLVLMLVLVLMSMPMPMPMLLSMYLFRAVLLGLILVIWRAIARIVIEWAGIHPFNSRRRIRQLCRVFGVAISVWTHIDIDAYDVGGCKTLPNMRQTA